MKTHEEIAAEARKLAESLQGDTLVSYTLRELANLIAETNERAARHLAMPRKRR